MKRYPLFAAALCLLTLGACNKVKKTTSCTPALYGYVGSDSTPWSPSSARFFSHINVSTMVSSPLDTLANYLYSNQATFNTSENCYYVFRSGGGGSVNKLFKITIGGSVTEFTNASGLQFTEGLVYNPVTNKLYCLLLSPTSSVAEITTSGTFYTVTPIATAGTHSWASPATSTVDNSTGDMYFSLSVVSTNTYSIEKYHPGASATTVVAGGAGSFFLGLRFNQNDNMLYAITENTSGSLPQHFIKVAPSGGSITVLAPLSIEANNEFYSATIDRCNNKYILSTLTGLSTNIVAQFNMSGTLVQTDTTAGLYQGLDILY